MKSGWCRWLNLVTWIVTALASINVGLAGAIKWDLFMQPWFQTNFAMLLMPAYWVIGICGVISLVIFCMTLFGDCCCCSCASCSK